MTALLEFITSKIGIYAVLSLVIAGMFLMTLNYKHKAAVLQSKMEVCAMSLNIQNTAVLNMKKLADVEAEKQAALVKEIEADKAKQYEQIKVLSTSTVPENCEEAVKWGISQLQPSN